MSGSMRELEWKPGSRYRLDGGPWMEPGPQTHVHEWRIGHVATEPTQVVSGTIQVYVQVAYLLCQCGAVKRTVCE